jgi:hypothetical protein
MQPGYQQEGGAEGEGSRLGDLRPPEPTAEVAEQCTAGTALAWLHAAARDPHMEPTEVGYSGNSLMSSARGHSTGLDNKASCGAYRRRQYSVHVDSF